MSLLASNTIVMDQQTSFKYGKSSFGSVNDLADVELQHLRLLF